MFCGDGVPQKMMVDNSKEQTLGKFVKKYNEVDCNLLSTESYSPYAQAAEGYIKEYKKSYPRRKLKIEVLSHFGIVTNCCVDKL